MLGEKIRELRSSNSLTQKDLAEKLYVTAQAVSRWENNEVEPSITTLTEMAKIFNISISELLGEAVKQQEVKPQDPQEEVSATRVEPSKPVLAVCECCNKPIYNGVDIVRKTEHFGKSTIKKVICKTCDKKQKEEEHKRKVYYGLDQRRKSFVWGAVFSGLITIIALIVTISLGQSRGVVLLSVLGGALFFPFISCLYLKNNFIDDVVVEVASWSIRFPGLIFTLDLDGILWFISVKLLFGILSFFLSACCFILAVILGYVLSIFAYPFALVKSIRKPELTEI